MTTEELRTRWMRRGLTRAELDPDPYRQFEGWYEAAIDSGIPEPNGMSLATVADDGQPWLRTVLLKLYDRNGFVFSPTTRVEKRSRLPAIPAWRCCFPGLRWAAR
jgi:pyridoxamine 5'-phosphate oxidase